MRRNLLIVAGVVLLVAVVAVVRERSASSIGDAVRAGSGGGDRVDGDLPRMVDLGSDKCVSCKEMAPILAELRKKYAGRAEIEFIDIIRSPSAGDLYNVRVMPTQVFFDREGREVWRHEGFLGREEIIAKLAELGARL